MSFWYVVYLITSDKYYQPILERIHSYVLPNATLQSENLFDASALLSDPLLRACFQETLRLQSQNASVRIVQEDTNLPALGKEYRLRKGSWVFIPAPLIHKDPEIYENVKDFEPERFLSADIESALVITSEHTAFQSNEKVEKKPEPKFFKRGVPVKLYMMPFGGGDNLVSIITFVI
jgi:cytochrome P450